MILSRISQSIAIATVASLPMAMLGTSAALAEEVVAFKSHISRAVAIATVADLPTNLLATSTALVDAKAAKTQTEDSVFIMINNTSVDMLEFYASPSDVDTWEEDIFEGYVLSAQGGKVEVTIEDDGRGCIYDFLAIFADGDEVDEEQINICETTEYTYAEY
ncbi:MAG: hypothetical protein AAF215_13885 [Cyanobacteria bacterium P01_A01_bin.123]